MDMKQLKCFVAVVEAGSFTRASEQLHTAQSALSHHITNLEAELGVQLFVRVGRGVELSPEGVIAYDRARKLLGEFRAFSRDLASTKREHTARKISATTHGGIGPLFLPQIARLVNRSDENVQFRLAEGLSEQIEREVCSGQCNIGLVIRRTGFQVERTDLETIRLVADDMFAIGASEDGNPIGETWSARVALSHPLVLAPAGSLERASFENWARNQNVALNIVGEAFSVPMRVELARHIGGICVLPGIGLADLLPSSRWKAHKIEQDEFYQGIEWFIIFRRTEGDSLIRSIVDLMQRQALNLLDRSAASFR